MTDIEQAKRVWSPRVLVEIRSVPITGHILTADELTMDGPDNVKNQAACRQKPASMKGLDFPILRCVCLISMFTGMLIDLDDASRCGKEIGETAILRGPRSSLRCGDILFAIATPLPSGCLTLSQ